GWGRAQASAMIQPPVLAQAVEAIGGEFVAEALPAVERYYRFLGRERDPDGDGLISIISQFESGRDVSPPYDPRWRHPRVLGLSARLPQVANKLTGYRAFRWHREDVLVNSVYADGLQALARLGVEWAGPEAARVRDALLERSWDE